MQKKKVDFISKMEGPVYFEQVDINDITNKLTWSLSLDVTSVWKVKSSKFPDLSPA